MVLAMQVYINASQVSTNIYEAENAHSTQTQWKVLVDGWVLIAWLTDLNDRSQRQWWTKQPLIN